MGLGCGGGPCQVTWPTSVPAAGVPVGVLVGVGLALGVGVGGAGQLFSSTQTLLLLEAATARSSEPSRLKSPGAAKNGSIPAGKVVGGPKVPVPVPSSTEM